MHVFWPDHSIINASQRLQSVFNVLIKWFAIKTTAGSSKLKYPIHIGNYNQKGSIRKGELWDSCRVLRIRDEHITIMNTTQLTDDPQVQWKAETIASQILKEVESLDIDALITFDREGVSHHPNHCAIYYATASLCLARLIPNRKK